LMEDVLPDGDTCLEVLDNDSLEHVRRDFRVPSAIWVHDHDRPLLTDRETVAARSFDAACTVRKPMRLQPPAELFEERLRGIRCATRPSTDEEVARVGLQLRLGHRGEVKGLHRLALRLFEEAEHDIIRRRKEIEDNARGNDRAARVAKRFPTTQPLKQKAKPHPAS